MVKWLEPDLYVQAVEEALPERLKALGIKALAVDLDNTLGLWRAPEITPEAANWVIRCKEAGVKVCILSNAHRRSRVRKIAQSLGVPYLAVAGKPWPCAYRSALRLLGTNAQETATVGDQFFADVVGGKLLGLKAVLVRPLSPKEFFGTKITRLVEGVIFRFIRKALERAQQRAVSVDEVKRN